VTVEPRRPAKATAAQAPDAQTHVSEMLSLVAGSLLGAAGAAALAGLIVGDQVMPDEVTTLVWYAIRIAGVLAYLTLWLTTISGICVSGGLFPRWGAVLMPLHALADLALSLALLHAALLLGDRFAGFTPETLVVPFRSSFQPFWTGFGIIALYLGALVFWSVHIRPKIGYARWRFFHYSAFVVYLLALLHGLFTGTDSPSIAMRAMYLATGGSVVGLGLIRRRALRRKAAEARETAGAMATELTTRQTA
jgi:hypothetical protein